MLLEGLEEKEKVKSKDQVSGIEKVTGELS